MWFYRWFENAQSGQKICVQSCFCMNRKISALTLCRTLECANSDFEFLKIVINGVLDVWVWTRNQGSIFIVDASIIPKAKENKIMTSKVTMIPTVFFFYVFFFIITELHIMNAYHKDRLLTNMTNNRFSVIFMMQFDGRDWSVRITQLAVALQQYTNVLFTLDNRFLG